MAVAPGSSRDCRASSTAAPARATSTPSALAIVLNGVVVAGFGVVALALYVDVGAGELVLFAACSAAGIRRSRASSPAVYLRRAGAPVRAWLGGATAASGRPAGVVGGGACSRWRSSGVRACTRSERSERLPCLVLAALLELPARQAALLFPVSFLLYVSSAVSALHRARARDAAACSRPSGERLQERRRPTSVRVSLHPVCW